MNLRIDLLLTIGPEMAKLSFDICSNGTLFRDLEERAVFVIGNTVYIKTGIDTAFDFDSLSIAIFQGHTQVKESDHASLEVTIS